MDKTKSESLKYWGIGCVLDVVLLFAVVGFMNHDQGASFFLYLMLFAIPAGLIRALFFTPQTSKWLRILLGPVGAILCVGLAFLWPLDFSSSDGGKDPVRKPQTTSVKPAAPETPPEKIEDVLAELDELVGLEGVKAEVRRIVNLVKINEARRKQGMKVPPMSYHMVFTGNPGTGKTTVARIVARAFVALGIIKNRQIVEVDRSGLVGRYAGETAVKTNQKIDEAMGLPTKFDKQGHPVDLTAAER
ncbi:MAG: AAA family ATPase, partial [Kiritimatiellae bacterium]|nr:AAA family ATPase [Kiritimatiellia bacterium]